MKKRSVEAGQRAGAPAANVMRDALKTIADQTPDDPPNEAEWEGREGEFAIVAAVYRLGQMARKALKEDAP